MPRFAHALLCTLTSSLAAACGADSGTPSTSASKHPPASEEVSATGAAYAALTGGKREEVTGVIAHLDDAVSSDPSDGRAVFYSAIMRFWQLGEQIDQSSNPVEVLTEANTMIDRFRKAQSMLRNDDRAPAFGGLAKVVIGNIVSDAHMRSEGMSDIDEGIAIFPAYSHFLRALASAESPAESDDFASVVPHMQAVLDLCGAKTDAAGKALYLEGPLPSPLRVCNDDGMVPHVWEGFLLNYGDLLLKAGKGADAARAMYEGAKLAPRFAKWPFGSALQERIDQADERAALYADSDAANDPKLWMQDGHICTGCHQDDR
jgi:hypothetical protein